ncbi:MAG: 50S ribosomal protein L11 methyltransferase [Candidatus Marinimicrobia bacterium]|nr:50S ribosomal protein L11 methyltransferase [Candidatus Neomarinimicrobiota bacterium]
MIKQRWQKVSIPKGKYDLDLFLGFLVDLGCVGITEGDNFLEVYFPYKDRKNTLAAVKNYYTKFGNGKYSIEECVVEWENWHLNWQKHFKPIKLGERIIIRKYTNKRDKIALKKLNGNFDIEILIKPGMAFGTGTHATTQMALILMEQIVKEGMSILDAGCGSGILTIAALKMGAANVDSWDNDPEIEENYLEHIKLNGIESGYNLKIGDVVEINDYHYDLIVSNIERKTDLRLLSSVIKSVSESLIIFSGILINEYGDFEKEVVKYKRRIINEMFKSEWVALVVR